MKAAHVTRYATNADELEHITVVSDAPKPTIDAKSSQLLIKVLACAFNPADYHIMAGHISFVMKAKFPYTPGLDICGIVEQVGDKCKQFKAGDRVIAVLPASNHAGMAEFARVDEQYVAPWPSTLSSLEAAGLPTAGCTAYDAFQNAKLPEGAKVIVLGASGGVGTLLVQLLRNAGASFIAATSTNATLVQSLGAHQVIDYRSSKWYQVLENKQLDAVFDCVGDRESWFNSHRALHRKGRYIAVTESPDAQICGIGDLLGFIGRALWRTLSSFKGKLVVQIAEDPLCIQIASACTCWFVGMTGGLVVPVAVITCNTVVSGHELKAWHWASVGRGDGVDAIIF